MASCYCCGKTCRDSMDGSTPCCRSCSNDAFIAAGFMPNYTDNAFRLDWPSPPWGKILEKIKEQKQGKPAAMKAATMEKSSSNNYYKDDLDFFSRPAAGECKCGIFKSQCDLHRDT